MSISAIYAHQEVHFWCPPLCPFSPTTSASQLSPIMSAGFVMHNTHKEGWDGDDEEEDASVVAVVGRRFITRG
jgi:hypothetical protein